MPTGLSLHIGLNSVDPNSYGGWSGDLDGCEPDASDMQKLASSLGYTTSVLLTSKATASAVMTAIVQSAKKLKSGDAFFLTYSGHGGQIRDLSGDEVNDDQDETWCLYDRQVIDDELYALYRKFVPGVRVFVLSDSCHSGTVIRVLPPGLRAAAMQADDLGTIIPSVYKDVSSPVRYRLAPKKASAANFARYSELFETVQLVAGGEVGLDPQAGVISISGCQDNQLSADLGAPIGLFTVKLLEARAQVGASASFRELYKAIRGKMPMDQTPNLMTVGVGGSALPDTVAFAI